MNRHLKILSSLALTLILGCEAEPKPEPAEAPAQEQAPALQDRFAAIQPERESEAPASEKPQAPIEEEESRIPKVDAEMARDVEVKNLGQNEALGSEALGQGPFEDIFDGSAGFDSKMNSAQSGEGGGLVVGRGAGGLGVRGSGVGGGGESFGRIGGLGKVDTGGGKGTGGKIGEPQLGMAQPSVSGPGEGYQDPGVNPMTKAAEDRFSTFAIDVDTGSYTIARRKLTEGVMPPVSSVRVEEFVNYFGYDYPDPDSGPFGVSLEAAPSPFDGERHLVRVGVQGKRVSAAQRKPVHLTFLVDVSGSMNRPDKLGLAKRSLELLTQNLKEGDTVSLVTYAGATKVVLPPTGMEQKGRILESLDDLRSGGGTAMNSGMKLAYQQAMAAHKPGHVNRVLVLSDGDANIGPSSHEDILARIRGYVDEGVTMSTIGFGMGNYQDQLMEQLANKGNGNYYYIDSIQEARKVFGEQLDGTLEVIAKDVKIQVEFNPEAVSNYRLIGYENRDIADKDFRNDAVDAGEIGAGHTVTAFYEVEMNPKHQGTLAYVRVRHKEPEGDKASEQIFMLKGEDVRGRVSDASRDFQFGAAVVAFAEILRGSPYAKDLSYQLVEEIARPAASSNQKDRQELLELVQKARLLAKKG